MIRTIGKAALLAAAVITAGTAFVNCSKKNSNDDIGSITLALTLSPGVVVNTVNYTISGNSITPIMGMIDVSMATTATAFVSGLPAGNGYTVSMTATSTDGLTMCTGNTTFNVQTGVTAMANVVLQCRGPRPQTGQVAINGRLDNCPFITGGTADRLQAPVGGVINFGVQATDYDATDTIAFSWTAAPTGIGTIGSATAKNTTFTCANVGAASLSVSITDGVCGDAVQGLIPVTCIAAGGTGGVQGTGGAVGTAGTGGAVGTAGTGGAVGTAGTGGAVGTAGTGGAVGTAGTGGAVGTGGTGGAVCIEGNNGGACTTCTADNCALGPTPGTDGCCGLGTQADRDLCDALYRCIQQNSATCTSGGDPTTCFCGSAPSGSTCFTTTGAANGACVNQFNAAAKSTDPVVVQSRFVSPLFPIGRAVNLSSCQGALCTECGIQ